MSNPTCPLCYATGRETDVAGVLRCPKADCAVTWKGEPAPKKTPRTFESQYHGFCHSCTERWAPGDLIGYSAEDDLCCADCLGAGVAAERPLVVCQSCFLVHAAGQDGCE